MLIFVRNFYVFVLIYFFKFLLDGVRQIFGKALIAWEPNIWTFTLQSHTENHINIHCYTRHTLAEPQRWIIGEIAIN